MKKKSPAEIYLQKLIPRLFPYGDFHVKIKLNRKISFSMVGAERPFSLLLADEGLTLKLLRENLTLRTLVVLHVGVETSFSHLVIFKQNHS